MRSFIASSIAITLAACAQAPSPKKPPQSAAPAPQTTVSAVQPAPHMQVETLDSGTFTVLISGKESGKESFRIDQRGDELEIHADTELTVNGSTLNQKSYLVTDLAWGPQRGELTVNLNGQSVTSKLTRREDGHLLLQTDRTGNTPESKSAPGPVDVFLADNVMIHGTPLCAAAGTSERTLTAFPAMKLVLSPAEQSRFAAAAVGQPEQMLTHIAADLGGMVRLSLYCNNDRLVVLRIPLLSVTAVRTGYEATAAVIESAERPKPETPDSLVEVTRTIHVPAAEGIEAATLDCSLMLPATHAAVTKPAARGPMRALPAVAFITGSGQQDRDEDTVGPGGLKLAIFKHIAIALGNVGIASLRCDDRGTGKSTGDFDQATLQAFAADVTAMVAALRAEPAVDPGHIGLIGHSEGGVIAPLVASRDPKITALVLMAGTGRPIDRVLIEQLTRNLRAEGLDEATIAKRLTSYEQLFAAIRANQPMPSTLSPVEQQLFAEMAPWLRSQMAYDPAATVRSLRKPAVMIAQGAKDTQVSVADAERLRDGLAAAGNQRVDYRIYPNLNHLFVATETGNIAEYSAPDADVDATFIADVVAFLKKHL